MTMTLKLLFTISCVVIHACAQQDGYHIGILNPDLIYFSENGQRFPPPNAVPLDTNNRANVDSYVQASLANQGQANAITPERAPVNNINDIPKPSIDLEPPPFKTPLGAQATVATSDRFSVDRRKIGEVQPNASADALTKIALAVSDFGINLMKSLQFQPGNIVISPFSITTLLALLQQGSEGSTQQQISTALLLTPQEAAEGLKRLTEEIKSRSTRNLLRTANAVFIADGFNINPAFKTVAKRDFDSDLTPIKFSRPTVAAQKINNWVASKTNDKIDKLISPDYLGDNTQIVLVNAVYFKGLWAIKFRPESTLPGDFFMAGGKKKSANFMRMRKNFKADVDRSILSEVLILPFEDDLYSLVLILPSKMTSIATTLASLTKEKLLDYQNFTTKEVHVEIPKFSVKSDTNLINICQKLGIVNIFTPLSQLSGLGAYRGFSPQVSSALHSAVLSIDEQGGQAAAATSVGAVALSYSEPSIVFKANRPFLAILWDVKASLPLFMAKIEDPVL